MENKTSKFLIKQISKKEFIILKLFKEETTKGILFWRKTTEKNTYKRVDKYGNKLFHRLGLSNYSDCVTYKSKKKAEKWIKNYKKYPKNYFY